MCRSTRSDDGWSLATASQERYGSEEELAGLISCTLARDAPDDCAFEVRGINDWGMPKPSPLALAGIALRALAVASRPRKVVATRSRWTALCRKGRSLDSRQGLHPKAGQALRGHRSRLACARLVRPAASGRRGRGCGRRLWVGTVSSPSREAALRSTDVLVAPAGNALRRHYLETGHSGRGLVEAATTAM